MPLPSINVMLDCGAFSAWRRGEVIDLSAYIAYVKSHQHLLECYVALDVIPGSLGRAPGSVKRPRTLAEIKVSGAESYANLQRMKAEGLRPIPTFHQGEELCWLAKMLRDGESYIGISPAKNMPWYVQQRWLDRIFAILTDRAGNALVKIHGFGIASVDFLKRYPFFSVDTAGWCTAAGKGKIYAPSYANGSPSYLCRPTLVTISEESEHQPPKHKYNRDRQFTKLTPEDRANVGHFIVSEAERTLAAVKQSPEERAGTLAAYYQRLIAALPDPIRFVQPRSLNASEREVWEWLMAARQPIEWSRPKLYFSTQNDKQWIRALDAVGARHHLLSYWHLKDRPGVLERYVNG